MDGEVAVDGDGHHGQDADAHGGALQEGRQLAHDLAVDPVFVDVVAEGDGQADAHHHQVPHGQVDEEDVGQSPHVAMSEDNEDDEHVAHQPHGEVEHVDDDENDGERLLVLEEVVAQTLQESGCVQVSAVSQRLVIVRGKVK